MSSSSISNRSISDIAGLLIRSPWIVVFALVFVGPGVIFAIIDAPLPIVVTGAVIERFLQLLVIVAVYMRAAQLLSPRRELRATVRFFCMGFLIELLLSAGAFLVVALPGMGAAIAIVSLFLILRLIASLVLYPMPFMDPLLSLHEAIAASRALTQQVPLTTLMITPLAFFIIASGLAFCIYPDGRLWWSAPASQAAAGLAHLCFVFRTASASILAAGLQYDSIAKKRASAWRSSPLLLLVSGILLWSANFVRAFTMLPAPTIEIVAAKASAGTGSNNLTVEIVASDSTYDFRGFAPQRFFIGGETGHAVTGSPIAVITHPVEGSPNSQRYILTFTSDRKPAELVELEDLKLWYGAVMVRNVRITQSKESDNHGIDGTGSRHDSETSPGTSI